MAQAPNQPAGGGGAGFVRQIVTDPKNVPDVMRLYGYPGASSEENHERLYLSPDLTNYVEIPANDVMHRMAVPAEQDPHGGVYLWVKKDAALIYKMAPAAQALASYFAGVIAGAAAAAGPVPQPWAAQYIPGAIGGNTLYPHVCTPQCNTHYPYCGTVTPACTYPGSVCGCRYPGAAAMAAASPLTLCAAEGGLCTPDCPTYPQRCGVSPICQVTAICQPTRMTPCFPTQGCGGGGGGGVGGGGGWISWDCDPDVAARAAAAPQAAGFGYRTVDWLCFPTPACRFGVAAPQAAAFATPACSVICHGTPACTAGCGGWGGGPVPIR
jgi:hypothetical protein